MKNETRSSPGGRVVASRPPWHDGPGRRGYLNMVCVCNNMWEWPWGTGKSHSQGNRRIRGTSPPEGMSVGKKLWKAIPSFLGYKGDGGQMFFQACKICSCTLTINRYHSSGCATCLDYLVTQGWQRGHYFLISVVTDKSCFCASEDGSCRWRGYPNSLIY